MSKIEDLIAQYCPEGVEWKTIGEISDVITGGEAPSESLKSSHPTDKYIYPIYGNGIEVYGYTNSYKIEVDAVTISSIGANTGAVYYRNAFFTPIIRLKVIVPKTELILSRFIFHFLSSIEITSKKSSVPNLNANDVKKITIPIPPLPVQEEIVRILDKFTALEAELEAELEARTRQYEYYRDQLLSFEGKDVEWQRIKTLFDIRNGYTPSKANTNYWQSGTVPWFRMEDIRENGQVLNTSIQYVNKSGVKGKGLFPADSIIVATSATIGEHALITIPHLTNQRFVSLSIKESFKSVLNIKFLFYYFYLVDRWCLRNTTKSSFASVDMVGFKNLSIPIPPLEEQERIVSILDKFDALVNDISQGLPAEIQARRKQYEYYRERLLTFDELAVS